MFINNLDDVELIKNRTQNNHKIYEKYSKLLIGIFFKKTRDLEYSRDLAQEVLIKIHQNIEKYDSAKPFNRWVRMIAQNYWKDEGRRKISVNGSGNYYNTVSIQDEDLKIESNPRMSKSFTIQNDFVEESDLFETIKSDLEPNEQVLFDLHFKKSMTPYEISIEIGLDTSDIKTNIQKILRKIRENKELYSDFIG